MACRIRSASSRLARLASAERFPYSDAVAVLILVSMPRSDNGIESPVNSGSVPVATGFSTVSIMPHFSRVFIPLSTVFLTCLSGVYSPVLTSDKGLATVLGL